MDERKPQIHLFKTEKAAQEESERNIVNLLSGRTGKGVSGMDAIIVTNGTAEEITALALAVQGRRGADGSKRKEPCELGPGASLVLDGG